MVLEQLRYGASRHMEAYDENTLRLIYILCLPLLDGVFASMLVSGAITTFSDILATSLTVFSGAGALAVLYSGSASVKEAREMVLNAAPYLVIGSIVVGAIAPIYSQLFNISLLKYATGLALLSIAADMAEIDIAENLPPHAVIITGMVLSIQSPSSIVFETSYLWKALMTSVIALTVLYLASSLQRLDIRLRYIRLGGASALALISASLLFSVPSEPSLVVLGLAFLASLK